MARYTQAEIDSRIKEIDKILREGVESVSSDGTSTKVNLDHLRKEREHLRAMSCSGKARRPVASRIILDQG